MRGGFQTGIRPFLFCGHDAIVGFAQAECVQVYLLKYDCHPGSRVSGYPGPTETKARWVPALASLDRDDSQFLIQAERNLL